MSRAGTTKGSKEKTKATVPQTPVIITEIVKGKFSENDWISMVERDDEEEYIVGIVDEIVNSTLDSIYRRYIDKQVVPFTITKAKEAVLLLIEWHFLARDEGEKTFDEFCWVEDDEPNGSTIDSWAQGTVPKVYVPLTMCSTEETNDLLPVTTTKDSDMETKGKEFSNGIIEEDVVELPEECKPERNEKFDDTTSLGKQAKFDTIDVSPGVVVIESGRTKKGPGHYARKPEPDVSEENLRPVTYSFKQHSAISVSDLLDRSTPIIRPFNGSHILPPITSTASIIM